MTHPTQDPTRREILAAALVVVVDLVWRGMVREPLRTAAGYERWTYLYLTTTETAERDALLAAMDEVEHYTDGPTLSGQQLSVWRGKLSGWPLSIRQFEPGAGPNSSPAAAYADRPAGQASGWPANAPSRATPPAQRSNQRSWWDTGRYDTAPVDLPSHTPAPTLTDPALTA